MIAAMIGRGRGPAGGLLLFLASACVSSPAAAAGPAPSVQIVRNYTGAITAATGHYAHAHGNVAVRLTLTTGEPFEAARPLRSSAHYWVSILVRGAICPKHRGRRRHDRCLALGGTLHGEGRDEEEQIPDTGGTVRFRAGSGAVHPLGAVAARCIIRGVGFIATRGRRSLILEIVGKGGTVWVAAHGALVPAFTPP
jgi:hypothetical protein